MMHVQFGTFLIVSALLASIVLVLARGDRIFPMIALVASGIEALIAFDVITMSVKSMRLDVILPALLVIAGLVCWMRMASRNLTTASTVVTMVGLIQLLIAVRVLR